MKNRSTLTFHIILQEIIEQNYNINFTLIFPGQRRDDTEHDEHNRRRGYSDKRGGIGSNQNRRSDNRNRNESNTALTQQSTSNISKIDESRDVSSNDRGRQF